jgi:biotin synthase
MSKLDTLSADTLSLSKQEIVNLLLLNDEEEIMNLFRLADSIREKYVGNKVYLRAIIEFSNVCKNNCKYCGIRRDAKIKRYRMKPDEIVRQAHYAADLGYGTVVLQSGEDAWYDDKIVDVIETIKETTNLAAASALAMVSLIMKPDRALITYPYLRYSSMGVADLIYTINLTGIHML